MIDGDTNASANTISSRNQEYQDRMRHAMLLCKTESVRCAVREMCGVRRKMKGPPEPGIVYGTVAGVVDEPGPVSSGWVVVVVIVKQRSGYL